MKTFFHILLSISLMSVFVQIVFAADISTGPDGVQTLVAKIVAAYGGEKVIKETTSVYAIGDIEALMRQDRGSYELFFKRPRKLKVDIKYQRSSETRVLDGNTGYRGANDGPLAEINGPSLLAIVYQYKHIDLPYGLLSGAYSITSEGKKDINGTIVEIIHLSDTEGPPMDVCVDVETFHIVKVTGYFVAPDGRTMALSSEFSDFRTVGNTVFPFKVINYAAGQRIAETIMKSYKINLPTPDHLFEPKSSLQGVPL
ncbi:MAG: hypothetical protein ACLPN1_02745 [Dissulfurispiraceae bacterium]|jgi:hypothetical protein